MSTQSANRGAPTPHPGSRRPTLPPTAVGRRVLQVLALLGLLAAVVLVRATLVGTVRVDSSSMSPTLTEGDVVLVTRRAPDVTALARGDLVMFRMPPDGVVAIKRVVGLPGDSVVIRDAELYVDGHRVEEPYVDHRMIDGYYSRTFDVPPNTVLVFGDNRGNSIDSRDYGPVAADDLLGRVVATLWPIG